MSPQRTYLKILIPPQVAWPRAWCSVRQDLGCLANHSRQAGFRVDLLADRLACSTRALRRECRTALGVCIKDWLVHVRIIEARKRLYGEESIAEIAYTLGFSHPKELSREFKSILGLSPTEFRHLILSYRHDQVRPTLRDSLP